MFIRKKTSAKWEPKYKKKYGMNILDPDGWDRTNFFYSWNREKITWKEFERRAILSSQVPIGGITSHTCFIEGYNRKEMGIEFKEIETDIEIIK